MNARTVAQIVAVAGALGTLVNRCAAAQTDGEAVGESSEALGWRAAGGISASEDGERSSCGRRPAQRIGSGRGPAQHGRRYGDRFVAADGQQRSGYAFDQTCDLRTGSAASKRCTTAHRTLFEGEAAGPRQEPGPTRPRIDHQLTRAARPTYPAPPVSPTWWAKGHLLHTGRWAYAQHRELRREHRRPVLTCNIDYDADLPEGASSTGSSSRSTRAGYCAVNRARRLRDSAASSRRWQPRSRGR